VHVVTLGWCPVNFRHAVRKHTEVGGRGRGWGGVRSSALSPLDLFLRGHLKGLTYETEDGVELYGTGKYLRGCTSACNEVGGSHLGQLSLINRAQGYGKIPHATRN
jgi:hypothetical protein